jgi:hypothetical protein
MAAFNVAKQWAILFSPNVASVKIAAEDISRCITVMRKQSAINLPAPEIFDAVTSDKSSEEAVIILNARTGDDTNKYKNGFSWRTGENRIEIYGDSPRGLCNGVYDFLSSLGFKWPAPEKETPPSLEQNGLYPFSKNSAYEKSAVGELKDTIQCLRRVVIDTKDKRLKHSAAVITWAARNKYDAVIISLTSAASGKRAYLEEIKKTAEKYAVFTEAGGRDLSLLVPRSLFLLHREIFRMAEGKRKKDFNFCATCPQTITCIQKEAGKYFNAASFISVFHLWPDKGGEKDWCACPSCRAFTWQEQNRIAVNAAAGVLGKLNPAAFISYYEPQGESASVQLKPNMFNLEDLPLCV